jgi:prepilin-type N-terminal cleavage/methylation domain-containing protein
MYTKVSNKKGLSLVELLVSIAILAVVAVPVFSSFISIASINVRTQDQQNIDAVARVIKSDIIDYVQSGNSGLQTDYGPIKLRDGNLFLNEATNIMITGNSSSSDYSNYRYDIKHNGKIIDNTGTGLIDNTHEYIVNVKKKDGASYKNIQSFRVNVFVE